MKTTTTTCHPRRSRRAPSRDGAHYIGSGFQKVGEEEGGESGVVDGEEVGFGYAFGGEPVFG